MKTLSNEECLRWFERHEGLNRKFATALDLFSAIPFRELTGVRYTVPIDSGHKVALARALFWQLKPEASVLVWLRNWMVWPSRAHLPMAMRLREALKCRESLDDAPGHLFEAAELDDAISLLILGLEFTWDCLVVD